MRSIAITFLFVAAPAAAQADKAWQPPSLTTVRYDEDWSSLAQDDGRTPRWTDTFKYVPLGPKAYLTTGLEVRLRHEAFDDNLWGSAPAPDDSYLWLRAMPHADLHAGPLRAFVQPIAAYAVGAAPSAGPIDQTGVDLLQGFADVRLGATESSDTGGWGLTLRAGRQMLSFGSERLIGTRYGPNVPLAFDGFRALLSREDVDVSLFAVRPVQAGLRNFDDRRSPAKSLWGLYASSKGIDLYYLGYRNRSASFGTRTGREVRHSLGVRSFGEAGEWHWNIEGVAQFGRFAGGDIRAWTIGTEVGRRFPRLSLAPDATMRFNMVSGDRHGGNRRVGTFNALFPKGKYFGELSPVGPYNIISANPRVTARLRHDLSASMAGMAYWRYARADGVYDIPGNLLRAPGTSRSRFIGKEAEATLAWQATPELELSTSLSVFEPGRFIRDTGPSKTIVMLGLESNFRF